MSYLGEELSAKRLKELINAWNATNKEEETQIKQRGASSIDLPPQIMKGFFIELFTKITDKVEELIEAAKNKHPSGVDFIFMVGGFSESPFLKAVVKERFEHGNIVVLVP